MTPDLSSSRMVSPLPSVINPSHLISVLSRIFLSSFFGMVMSGTNHFSFRLCFPTSLATIVRPFPKSERLLPCGSLSLFLSNHWCPLRALRPAIVKLTSPTADVKPKSPLRRFPVPPRPFPPCSLESRQFRKCNGITAERSLLSAGPALPLLALFFFAGEVRMLPSPRDPLS